MKVQLMTSSGLYEGVAVGLAPVMQVGFTSKIYWEGGYDEVLLSVDEYPSILRGKLKGRYYGSDPTTTHGPTCFLLIEDVKDLVPLKGGLGSDKREDESYTEYIRRKVPQTP